MKTSLEIRGKRRGGFSLIEILIAVVVLAVLAVGGAVLMPRAGASVTVQKNKRAALYAAEQRLEQLRAQPYCNINDGSFGSVSSTPDETVAVNGVESSPAREFVEAAVYVEYRSGETVSLSTVLR